jgi:glutathione S-transferase
MLAFGRRAVAFFVDQRFHVRSEEAARAAERTVVEGLDRLEAELGGRELLCGDAPSVADIAAASLLYPLALPPERPWQPARVPAAWRRFMDEVRDRPGVAWVRDMYARRRHAGAAQPGAVAA